jgi:peroxiredoxin Q/BCP
VSFDTVEENAAFAKKFLFPFPLLCDPDRTMGPAYGACDPPCTGNAKRISYLLDAEGKIVKAYAKVDAQAHPAEVLRDAKELL